MPRLARSAPASSRAPPPPPLAEPCSRARSTPPAGPAPPRRPCRPHRPLRARRPSRRPPAASHPPALRPASSAKPLPAPPGAPAPCPPARARGSPDAAVRGLPATRRPWPAGAAPASGTPRRPPRRGAPPRRRGPAGSGASAAAATALPEVSGGRSWSVLPNDLEPLLIFARPEDQGGPLEHPVGHVVLAADGVVEERRRASAIDQEEHRRLLAHPAPRQADVGVHLVVEHRRRRPRILAAARPAIVEVERRERQAAVLRLPTLRRTRPERRHRPRLRRRRPRLRCRRRAPRLLGARPGPHQLVRVVEAQQARERLVRVLPLLAPARARVERDLVDPPF